MDINKLIEDTAIKLYDRHILDLGLEREAKPFSEIGEQYQDWWKYVAKQILSGLDVYVKVDAVRECADEDGAIQKYKDVKYIPLAQLIKEVE